MPVAVPGAYALIFSVERVGLEIAIPTLPRSLLQEGLYAYFGDAWGSGGLAGRVSRHLRTKRARHWHVDHLLHGAHLAAVWVWPQGRECIWRADVQARAGAGVPIPGFGSSDCRQCPAHLLRISALADVARADASRLGIASGDD